MEDMPESPSDPSPNFETQQPGGKFTIKSIYCKDISFETPNSPALFRSEWKPEIEMQLGTEAREIAHNEYEVVLTVTVTTKLNGNTAFLAEVKYAGLFDIAGLTSDELGRTLGSQCPGILFPYTRELVSGLVVRGGFPPLVLAPVNFEALYENHLHKQSGDQPAAPESQS